MNVLFHYKKAWKITVQNFICLLYLFFKSYQMTFIVKHIKVVAIF